MNWLQVWAQVNAIDKIIEWVLGGLVTIWCAVYFIVKIVLKR